MLFTARKANVKSMSNWSMSRPARAAAIAYVTAVIAYASVHLSYARYRLDRLADAAFSYIISAMPLLSFACSQTKWMRYEASNWQTDVVFDADGDRV